MRPLLLLLLFCCTCESFAQSPGDYRTANINATWSTASDWQVRGQTLWTAATTAPGAGDNVFIQTGHSVSLTANAACNNLNIENSGSNRLALGAFTLSVNGLLRSFVQSAPAATGSGDGTLYTGGPGTPPSTSAWISSSTGKIAVTGGSRTLTMVSQWGAGNAGTSSPNGFDLEINLNTGATVTCNTALKARTVTIHSGTLDMQGNRLSADMGLTTGSTIAIHNGGALASAQTGAGNQVASRTGSARLDAFTLLAGGMLILSGTSPAIDANTITLNGTVSYTKAGNQTLLQKGSDAASVNIGTYTNLVLDGSGTKTPALATTVNGTLSRQGTALVSATPAVLYGPASTLEYGGSSVQTSGPEFSTASPPFNLRLNNSSNIILNGIHTISGNLDLSSGLLLISGADKLSLADNATVSNASAASFIAGPLTKTGDDGFTFPVGAGTKYRPVKLGAPANASDAFTVQYFNAPCSTATVNASGGLNHISYKEYWDIARSSGSSTVDVTLNWGSGSGVDGSQLSALRLARFNGIDWDNLGVNMVTTSSIRQINVNSFGLFTIASISASQPLHLLLTGFSAKPKEAGVALEWTTTCESGMGSFEIQRGTASAFTRIGEIQAMNQGCDTQCSYAFADFPGDKTQSYYRLLMTDLSGRTAFSDIVRYNGEWKADMVEISPNPATQSIRISGLQAGQVFAIFDIMGRRAIRKVAEAGSELVGLEGLRPGMYFLRTDSHSPLRFTRQ